jgi:superoxide dismutase, Fe-Mn family
MYKLINLNYSYEALEPYIDAKTVEIHYSKHHQNYLNKTNAILEANGFLFDKKVEELVLNHSFIKETDRVGFLFNLGGVLNHNLYWTIMSPNKNILPVGKIKDAIELEFTSYEVFKEKFIALSNTVMGSGWVFLVVNKEGKLEIIKTSNQETPYQLGYIPVIALDLWEHSYYLKYQNLRPDYINNFFNVVDFEVVNRLYEEALHI